MTTHTVLGYNVVKDANFPLSIQLGVLEHHERETGNGYPRHLTSDKISLYAKIIAVACSYEAISAPRHFRDAHTTFDAIVELLKNANHQYDDTVVKALLYTVSLYPIGAYVYLANGKIAQVVDVNPANQRNPIVQIIGEKELDGSPKTVQTNDAQLKIIRVMNKTESDDVLKAISSQENAQTTN
jgi:HD-GYP domain-containing protein (c-di-GMP phosphodiesterase class II)